LVKLARAYGRQVNDFVRPRPPIAPVPVQFRGPSQPTEQDLAAVSPVIAQLQDLARDYLELEELTASPLVRKYPPEYPAAGPPEPVAEAIALDERNRLGLGDGPIPRLRDLLEQDVGLRIYYLPLPPRYSETYIFSDDLGACIVINRHHPPERQRWSLAHAYLHFLCHRAESVVFAADGYQRRPEGERLADAFANFFLMPTGGLARRFTDIVRGQLRADGLLRGEEQRCSTVFSLQWTNSQMRDARNYQPGQVILFHRSSGPYAKGDRLTVVSRENDILLVRFEDGGQAWFSPRHARGYDVGIAREIGVAVGDRLLLRSNQKSAKLRNGDIVEVVAFATDGSITLRDGRSIPSLFREFSHGYATTSHAAQGKTVDHGILLMGDAGIAAGNLKQAYVSNSRFRESQTIYTTDRREAREAMMTSGDRKLVTEMVAGPESVTGRARHGLRSHATPSRVAGGSG